MTGRRHATGSRPRVRYGDNHAGGDGGSGGRIGLDGQAVDGSLPAHVGGVRKSIAELRAEAELARYLAPSRPRYIIWQLAKFTGQPISEVENVRLDQAAYFADFWTTGKVPDGDR